MNCRKEIRLSCEELEELNRKAKERGLSDSQYLRMLITNRPRDYPELLEALQNLTNEINHIGININQIVKNNNSGLYHESDEKTSVCLYEADQGGSHAGSQPFGHSG